MEIRRTEKFAKWLDGLDDVRARARILVRVERLATGNAGDIRPVGEGVSELRIDYGPGYRVYFTRRGQELIILLVVATRARKPPTSRWPCGSRATYGSPPWQRQRPRATT